MITNLSPVLQEVLPLGYSYPFLVLLLFYVNELVGNGQGFKPRRR
jgi:hypothetical protein